VTPWIFRACRPDDREALAGLWLESWRSTGLDIAQATTRAELSERIASGFASGWQVTLAERHGGLAGFLALKPAEACLDQLFVGPREQGAGLGAALLALAKARLPGGMWLRTAEANTGAQRFYLRHGFRLTERAAHPRLGHGAVILRWP
jgi:GNAT superfamily N-acetyltransferase